MAFTSENEQKFWSPEAPTVSSFSQAQAQTKVRSLFSKADEQNRISYIVPYIQFLEIMTCEIPL